MSGRSSTAERSQLRAVPGNGGPQLPPELPGEDDRSGGGDGLVRVAWTRNIVEAEFLVGLLAAEGIAALIRRSAGADVPDFLAAGPRDVLVHTSRAADARDVLLQHDEELSDHATVATDPPWRVLAGLLIGLVLLALIAVFGLR